MRMSAGVGRHDHIGQRIMPINVNCISFRYNGKCIHQAAPRRMFGPALCIVWLWDAEKHTDPRETQPRCALCTPLDRPKHPPKKP